MAKNNIKIALYQPDIPQNTAAIIRLCACFNTRLDIIGPAGFIMNDKRFKRISMDYINNCEIKSYQNYEKFKNDRKKILFEICKLEKGELENAESLEQLRWLENNYKITTALTQIEGISIDTPKDLEDLLKTL